MAYYPAEFVERIRMIKQLQEERYMPLRVIKDLLEEDPDRAKALIELGDKMLERALAGEEERISAAEVRDRYDVPQEVLDRLAELEVLTPDKRATRPATSGSSRRSAASARAATTSGSASPSTTPSATRRRWRAGAPRRSTC